MSWGEMRGSGTTSRHAYIAGPMSGYGDFNFAAFKAAANDLRARGWTITSPHELDQAEGFDPTNGVTPEQYARFLARDIDTLATNGIDAIIVLPGWRGSAGAKTEVTFARAIGLDVLRYPELTDVERSEVRIVDPNTGGAKGRKPERWDLLPFAALDELARVYGFGATKYEDDNYLKGYSYRLSLGALLRHVSAWSQHEDNDPESGLHHLAHAAWHCLALIMFQREGLGEDDRWRNQDREAA